MFSPGSWKSGQGFAFHGSQSPSEQPPPQPRETVYIDKRTIGEECVFGYDRLAGITSMMGKDRYEREKRENAVAQVFSERRPMRRRECCSLFLELTTMVGVGHQAGCEEVYSSMPMSLTRPKAAPAAMPPTIVMLMAPQR